MSRSYYEWCAAREAWREAQGRRVSSLPYPDQNSIVYARHSMNPFWERRYETARSLISSSYNLNFDTEEVAAFIESAAETEARKEDEFLEKFFPDFDRNGNRVDQFNILFQSRDQLDRINERMRKIFDKQSSTNMAPDLSAIFGSYLETELNHALQGMMGKFSPDMTPSAILEQFNQAFEKAVMAASERMTKIVEDKGFGTGKEWKPVHEALNGLNPRVRQLFIASLKQAIGVNEEKISGLMGDIFGQQADKAAGLRKKVNYRNLLAGNLKIAKQTAQIGGTVTEQVLAIIASMLNGVSGGGGGIQYQMHAEGVLGNMVKTDSMMLFSENATIDVPGIVQDFNQMLTDSKSLDQARVIFGQFSEKYKEQMDELYGVFVNAKNYTLGSSYSDYTDEKSGTFEELPDFLTDAGINIGDAKDFLSFVYNTCQGAVFQSARGYVEETTVNALKAAAAKIMFDDYQTYGQGDGHNIHMYFLSGKYIPASYVFRGMADAASGMKAKTVASVSLRDEVDDRGPKWGFEGSDADYKEALLQHWYDEYEATKAAATWSVKFTLYIKNILQSTL